MTAFAVWAVFSAYRPSASLLEAARSVTGQVTGVVVVDDGSGDGFDETWSALETIGAVVERRGANAGIAAALNYGIDVARGHGADAVLTLDQDSSLESEFVASLLAAMASAEQDAEPLGAVVPEYFAAVRQARGDGGGRDYIPAADVIQSGMLIPLATLDRFGGFREDFFIDRVDTEFELRLEASGMPVRAARGVRLGHALGTQYRRTIFGRPASLRPLPDILTLSTPFRYFYRVRNRLVLNRMYLRRFPARIARDTFFDVAHFVDALAAARPRLALWRVYRAGIVAAVRGHGGAMPPSLAETARTIQWRAIPVASDEEAPA